MREKNNLTAVSRKGEPGGEPGREKERARERERESM